MKRLAGLLCALALALCLLGCCYAMMPPESAATSVLASRHRMDAVGICIRTPLSIVCPAVQAGAGRQPGTCTDFRVAFAAGPGLPAMDVRRANQVLCRAFFQESRAIHTTWNK